MDAFATSRSLICASMEIGSNAVRLVVGGVVEREDHPVIVIVVAPVFHT